MAQLDAVDRGILYMLQRDARNNSASVIAEAIQVAPNTVRNRIDRLENEGVIDGYLPQLNYERAGYQLRVVFVCSVPIAERQDISQQVMHVDGVIEVREMLSGHQNLLIEVVGIDGDDITDIARKLENLDITIQEERFVKAVRSKPFSQFGDDIKE